MKRALLQTYRFRTGVDLTNFMYDVSQLTAPEWVTLRIVYAEVRGTEWHLSKLSVLLQVHRIPLSYGSWP